MSVKVRCPACSEKFYDETGRPGEKIRCPHCGQAVRLPGGSKPAGAEASEAAAPDSDAFAPSGMIRFRCPSCSTKYSTPSNLAGKKIRCKQCGAGVRVPGELAADVVPSGRAKSRVEAEPEKPRKAPDAPPTGLDLYGLQDEPLPARQSGGAAAESAAGANSDDEGPLPQRPSFGPLTEAQKKKIAKRAAKLDREKKSFAGAGMSVSLGSVLAIVFFGWRMMRWMNRANRVALAAGAIMGADGEIDEGPPPDPQVVAAQQDKEVETELKKASLEAREWLDPKKHPNHGVFEMGNELGRKMVEGFYERGAQTVYVLDPTPFGNVVLCAQFAIKLPADPAQRQKCFDWEIECIGLDPEDRTKDVGQHYLTVTTD